MGGRVVLQVSLLTLVLTFRLAGCFSQTHVPVAIWSNERHSIFPEALAGHNIDEDTFSRKYLGAILGSNTSMVVFIQEQMSAQDITDTIDQEDGSFTHLTNLLDNYPSTYLPNVESATLALERMGGLGTRKVFQLTPPFQLPDYLTANPMQSLFLVDIPTSSLSMPFQSADEIIGSVTGLLEQMSIPYTAIYTATHPSSRDRTDDVTGHVGRRILQVDGSNDYTFVNISNCLYFYAENISLMINGNSFLLGNPVLGNNSYCANYTALMSLVYDNPAAGLQTATLDMHFACTTGLNVGYWYMSNFSIGYTMVNSTTNQTESNTTAMFPYFVTETPFGFSYSCSYLPQIPEMEFIDTGTRYVNITFTKFQVQAFYITYDSFGYYNDCVGFFTITIWAVLITLAFMFGILTFGICIMTSLETGDRTDDPKGKQIIINTVD